MKLSEIRTVLLKHPERAVDPDATFAAFEQETGSNDPERFAAYLHEKTLIDDVTFRDLHAREEIEITRNAGAANGPLRSEPTMVLEDAADVSNEPTLLDTAGNPTLSVVAGGPAPPRPASPPPARSTPASAGARRRYRLVGQAGKGGMGTVHVAKDLDLLRKVAFKELSPEAAGLEGVLDRFVKEVQITAQLDHPNIVPVYSLEMAPGGRPAYTMKLVQGRTFRALLEETKEFREEGRTPDEDHGLPTLLEHFLKVCDAVAYAHDKGVLHRDLKPENLMLGRHNEVYVMDWGLSTLRGGGGPDDAVSLAPEPDGSADERIATSTEGTRLGTTVGTPRYMSPEQANGLNRDLDGRSDLYALGLILHEIATLRQAVEGKTLLEVVANAAAGRKRAFAPAYAAIRLPHEIEAIGSKATAVAPNDRYATVDAFADDLRRFLRGEAILARPETPLQKLGRRLARNRQATALALVGLAALVAFGLLFGLWIRSRDIEARQVRRARIESLVSSIAAEGDQMQSHVLGIQGLLSGFSAAVVHVLEHGQPSDERFYSLEDFRDPKRRPPDAGPSPRYEGNVSAVAPVWSVPPGVRWGDVMPTVRRLVMLRFFRRRMFFESRMFRSNTSVEAMDRSALGERSLPLLLTTLGFENGLLSVFPGTDAFPKEYDPRAKPWYTLAAGKRGPQWGNPYVSTMGLGPLLPCSHALYDDRGKFLGVASVLMSFDYLVRELLAVPGQPAVFETFLLDPEGQIVVRSRRGGETAPLGAVKLEPFPDRRVVAALAKQGSGSLETAKDGRAVIAAWDRIDPIGFTFVALADTEALFANP